MYALHSVPFDYYYVSVFVFIVQTNWAYSWMFTVQLFGTVDTEEAVWCHHLPACHAWCISAQGGVVGGEWCGDEAEEDCLEL